jgi:predicted DNA binding CopG/RHH family protein
MSQKKPSRLSTKPSKNTQAVNRDSWVENRHGNDDLADESLTKRITFEVSEKQHRATKILAAQKGMTIKELMQSLLVTELNKNQ